MRTQYQIPIEPKHVHKAATITSLGLYEHVRIPFGLRNAAQTFSRFADEVTIQRIELLFLLCAWIQSLQNQQKNIKNTFMNWSKDWKNMVSSAILKSQNLERQKLTCWTITSAQEELFNFLKKNSKLSKITESLRIQHNKTDLGDNKLISSIHTSGGK